MFLCLTGCQENKDIAFILDASASVGPLNFELMLRYVASIVKKLTAYGQEHRFSLITYSTGVKTIFSFDRYNTVGQILEAVQTTSYTSGSTNTAGGLREAIQIFQPGKKFFFVLKYFIISQFFGGAVFVYKICLH